MQARYFRDDRFLVSAVAPTTSSSRHSACKYETRLPVLSPSVSQASDRSTCLKNEFLILWQSADHPDASADQTLPGLLVYFPAVRGVFYTDQRYTHVSCDSYQTTKSQRTEASRVYNVV